MVPIIHALPKDLTGTAATNLVVSEVHSIAEQGDDPYRIVVLDKGYFYTDTANFGVYDAKHNLLTKGIHYQCIALNKEIVNLTGFNACAVIVITHPKVVGKVYVTAQMVGGDYCSVKQAIIDASKTLLKGGKRKVYYKDLIDKPSSFKPNGHQHPLWEWYGFTGPTNVLKRISVASNTITGKKFDAVYKDWKTELDKLNNNVDMIEERLTIHIKDTFNPHKVTAVQVKLEFVTNGAPATKIEAEQPTGDVMTSYATPLRAKQSLAVNFDPMFNQHRNSKSNPHEVTYVTLGTYDLVGLNNLAGKYYDRGTTVQLSTGIGGRQWAEARTYTRTNVPANQLTIGTADQLRYAKSIGAADTTLRPTIDGYMDWFDIRATMKKYVKQGNKVIYVSTVIQNPGNVQGGTWLDNTIGTTYAPGTICVFRWYFVGVTFTGNGAVVYTTVSNITMYCMQNGRWSIPGWGFPDANSTPPIP